MIWQDCRSFGTKCSWDSTHNACIDGRDAAVIWCALLMLCIGTCYVVWCLGWCMKDTGRIANLRRHGIKARARVTDHWTQVQRGNMRGHQVAVENFFLQVEFERSPAPWQCRSLVFWNWFNARYPTARSRLDVILGRAGGQGEGGERAALFPREAAPPGYHDEDDELGPPPESPRPESAVEGVPPEGACVWVLVNVRC